MKTCVQCQLSKELADFSPYERNRNRGLRLRCKDCNNLNDRNKRKANPEAVREKDRAKYWRDPEINRKERLKREFGLTLEGYANMLAGQKGVCAICKTPPASNRRLAVDHCHTTGRIRQLLCTKCNTALGFFKESAEIVQAAADYLRRHA